MKYAFPFLTLLLVCVSWCYSREKTLTSLKIAYRRFMMILPAFMVVLLLTSLVLGFISPSIIERYLGSSSHRWIAMASASIIGSITVMPGFVAFPLGGILLENGVPYMVISAFTTTLMMVGIVTFPIEKAFLGTRVSLVRNLIGLGIALVVACVTGLYFGEILP